MSKTILVVDDEETIRQSVRGILIDEGFEVITAKDGDEAIERVAEELPDLVLLDVWMPGSDGVEVLKCLKKDYPYLQVVMISGHGTIETAVKAIKLGAYDFIEKPLSLEKTLLTINNALNFHQLSEENRLLRQKTEGPSEPTGNSKAIIKLKQQIEIVAPTNAWVLITGENGTGKELVARAIHRKSQRADKPFVEVNSAAIPEELIESDLFGHEKGSFTGAYAKKRGKFDLAHEGTLFFDEIGDMSLKTQAKILRILQEQKFERVGGTKTIEVDVRVIAATNKDLKQEIRKGVFREDLYYRLNVIPIEVPPLRDRLDDIPMLVEEFLEDLSFRSRLPKKEVTPEALELLMDYKWPGNVRELKNMIERLVILTPGNIITANDIPDSLKEKAKPDIDIKDSLFKFSSLKEAKSYFEKEFILKKLAENNGNISQTAQTIGVERSHLHKKIRAYGVEHKIKGPRDT
ncbi:MAG TPA: sigma-54-dependent Fis family transcriptional regulator [Syntrophaceae bacterium]|nr:sigma-54-dependent Fis family transcriptional regulator [Syntrophaceae bacterium]